LNREIDFREIILQHNISKISEFIKILMNKYEISKEDSIKLVKELIKYNKLNAYSNKDKKTHEQKGITEFIKHFSTIDLWGMVFIIIIYLISYNFSFLIFLRNFFGLFFIFFVPGYCFINILYPNDYKMNRLLKIVFGVILSVFISSLTLYFINVIFQHIDEIYSIVSLTTINIGLILFAWLKRFKYFEFNQKYYSELKNKSQILKNIIIPLILIFVLSVLFRIFINYYSPFYNTIINYFNWASDQWIHYAFVRDTINYSYFDTTYMNLYGFFYPTFYMSLTGAYFITNLNLFSLFKWIPIYLGSFIVIALVLLSKTLLKKWSYALITGLMISVAAPAFLSSTGVVWPQIIGHYLIICLMICFYRMYKNASKLNIGLYITFFIFLSISHIVSIIVGVAIFAISFILITFKKGFNTRVFLATLVCIVISMIWTIQFNISEQIGIRTTFDLLKYLGLGVVGIGVALIFLYLVSRKINKDELQPKFKLGPLGYILLIAFIAILYNPLFWYYFPLTKDIINFLTLNYFMILFITVATSLICSIIGFLISYNINKIRHIMMLGWLLGLALMGAFFCVFGNFEEPSRIIMFAFEPLAIYSSIFIVSFLRKSKKFRCIFLLLTVILTPLNIYTFTTVSIGSGTIDLKSEVIAAQWFDFYYNNSEDVIYLCDTRTYYLYAGICWNRSYDFIYTKNLDYLKPENFDLVMNLTNYVYNGSNAVFMTNYFSHKYYYHVIIGSDIDLLQITPDLEQGWVNSSSRPYLRIYSSQYTEIYFIQFINITQ